MFKIRIKAMADAVPDAVPDEGALANANEVATPNSNKGTKMDEWTPLVIAAMRTRFGEKADELFTLLRQTHSLISGGSVLSACIGEAIEGQDTDIYVPVAHIPRFLYSMIMPTELDGFTAKERIYPATHYKKYAASFYCSSFLRKNGIRKVYNFGGEKTVRRREEDPIPPPPMPEVDIMSVRNKRGPLAVVNNFDLTFCQVWFDGKDVYASHPDHIKAKTGILQKDYCITLLGGNRFLKRRIAKYLDRGFKVTFDKSIGEDSFFKSVLDKIALSQNANYCPTPVDGLRDWDNKYTNVDSEFVQKWYNRIAMRYFLGVRDGDDLATNDRFLVIPLKNEVHNNQIKRLDRDAELHNRRLTGLTNFGDYRAGFLATIESFKLKADDGYDTDDMSEEQLKHLALRPFGEGVTDLQYHRECTKLVFNVYVDQGDGETTLGSLANGAPHRRSARKAKQLINIIESKALRTGEDLFAIDGKLYDIHEHPLEGATTRPSLEEYLGGTMTGDDYEPKCYYSGAGCDKKLKTHEIKAIVSKDFYARFSAPRPVKSGLNIEVDNFESVFRNAKSVDPAWGNIYHATMCPYCLKFEERGYGCAYMTHENPKGLGHSKAPFCAEGRAVLELVNKYKAGGRALADGYSHLEFCVECGRPCSGHKHFNFDMTAMVDNQQIPDPRHPGQMMYDYGNCPGGGRPELIARMMAVRDVYRRKDLKNVVEERRIAALAADAAPTNAALMARANALWLVARPSIEWNERKGAAAAAARAAAAAAANAAGKPGSESEKDQTRAALEASAAFVAANPEPPLVKWNVDVPKTKKYNDPLYANDENDPDFAGWLDGEQPVAAPAVTAFNMPRPDVPANAAQLAWNHRLYEGLLMQQHPLDDEEVEQYFEALLQVAGTEIQEIPAHGIDVINISLANALLVFTVCELPINKVFEGQIINALAEAIILGGDRVKNGLDPDVYDQYHVIRLAALKKAIKAKVNERLAGLVPLVPVPGGLAAPAPAAAAPAGVEANALAHFEGLGDELEGGKRSDSKRSDSKRSDQKRSDDKEKRKTYKRRTGIPKKKTRVTRRH